MTQHPHDLDVLERHVRYEAGAWGILTTTNTALVGPLLLHHGAGPLAFGVYNGAVNLFGLGAAGLGPRLARHRDNPARVILGVLAMARMAFLAVPLLLLLTDRAVAVLVTLLVLWAVGEGVALPLWTALLAGAVPAAERGRRLARRAGVATAAGVGLLVPALILLAVIATERALQMAYAAAAIAGLAGLVPLRASLRAVAAPVSPRAEAHRPAGRHPRFLAGVGLFWFGAALNRPVLPAYLVGDSGPRPCTSRSRRLPQPLPAW